MPLSFQVDESSPRIEDWTVQNIEYCNQARFRTHRLLEMPCSRPAIRHSRQSHAGRSLRGIQFRQIREFSLGGFCSSWIPCGAAQARFRQNLGTSGPQNLGNNNFDSNFAVAHVLQGPFASAAELLAANVAGELTHCHSGWAAGGQDHSWASTAALAAPDAEAKAAAVATAHAEDLAGGFRVLSLGFRVQRRELLVGPHEAGSVMFIPDCAEGGGIAARELDRKSPSHVHRVSHSRRQRQRRRTGAYGRGGVCGKGVCSLLHAARLARVRQLRA